MAKWVTLAGIVGMEGIGIFKGEQWAMETYAGKETWITLANFTSLAIIMAVLEEGSLLNRLCSQKWICVVGGLSYSLYVFHLTFRPFFLEVVPGYLTHYMRISYATLVAAFLALCTTFALSLISYRFIELPLFNLKRHIPYGAEVRGKTEEQAELESDAVSDGIPATAASRPIRSVYASSQVKIQAALRSNREAS